MWNERVRWGWESDYKERRREIELFKVNRGYGKLVERLKIERIVNNEDLPCDGIIAVVNDDNAVYNKHLPGDKIGVLVADDDYDDEIITYLVMTKNTKGDLTIPDVDKFYDRII